jgi:hypothetical protein
LDDADVSDGVQASFRIENAAAFDDKVVRLGKSDERKQNQREAKSFFMAF